MLLETMKIDAQRAESVFAKSIALGRTGTPEDCAAAVFFASPAAAWSTGQPIDVAGGQ